MVKKKSDPRKKYADMAIALTLQPPDPDTTKESKPPQPPSDSEQACSEPGTE